MRTEPILTREDRRCWERWCRTWLLHSRTNQHRKRVEQARRVVKDCLEQHRNTAVMWSGGKDSTAMTHLVCAMNPGQVVVSEKDDLDYPGEREYVQHWGEEFGARLDIITPAMSPSEWIAVNAHLIQPDEDFHSRAAQLSRECFYGLVEEANSKRDLVFLGLRKDESRGRLMNRVTRGLVYRKRPTRWNPSGLTVANPLGDWSGHDVYAYLLSRDIEPLHVYRCVWLCHADAPWRVRKSWWIPGADTRWGGVAWLRRYYPGLYGRLLDWWPEASRFS